MSLENFFQLCCRKAGVEPTERQLHKFRRGDGAAYAYACRSGNKSRAKRLIKQYSSTAVAA